MAVLLTISEVRLKRAIERAHREGKIAVDGVDDFIMGHSSVYPLIDEDKIFDPKAIDRAYWDDLSLDSQVALREQGFYPKD